MYCINCGNKLIEGAKFCGACGHKVEDVNNNINFNNQFKEENVIYNDDTIHISKNDSNHVKEKKIIGSDNINYNSADDNIHIEKKVENNEHISHNNASSNNHAKGKKVINNDNNYVEKKVVNNENTCNNKANNDDQDKDNYNNLNSQIEEKMVNNENTNYNSTINNNQNITNNENIKLYKILAYVGFLFFIGMVVNEKDDKSLRFHVGQGILVFILDIVVVFINNVIVRNLFGKQVFFWGMSTSTYEVSTFGQIITYALYTVVFVFSIMGIINVAKNEDKKLPFIGSLAFYK